MNSLQESDKIHFDTRILSYLISIIDEGSLTHAADKHYLSQPAMSRYLRELEEKLDTKLFTRSHNSLQLTESGMIFANGARSILHVEQEMEERLSQLAQAQSTRAISLAMPGFLLSTYKKQMISQWNLEYPDFHISCQAENSDEIYENLRSGVLDLGIILTEETDNQSLLKKRIRNTEIVCCLPGNQIPLSIETDTEQFLKKHAADGCFIATEDRVLRDIQERILRKCGVPLTKTRSSSQTDILIDLAKMGYGPIILPSEAIQDSVDPWRIRSFEPPVHVSISLAWNRKSKYSNQIQHFSDTCHFVESEN